MELHNETTLTPEILYSVEPRALRNFIIIFLSMSMIITSFVCISWTTGVGFQSWTDWIFLILAIAFLGRVVYRSSPWGVKRNIRKLMGEKKICRYIFRDEEVYLSSQSDFSSQEWTGKYASFQKMKVRKKQYLCLYFDSFHMLTVDKNGFASEEEWNQLLDFLKTKNL